MSYGDDEVTEAGKQQWITQTLELRQEAVELLSVCTSHAGVNNFQTVNVPQAVKELHAAVIAYSDQIRPKNAKLRDGLWDVDLTEKLSQPVRVPADKFEKREDDGEEYLARVGYEIGYYDRHGDRQGESLLSKCKTEVWPIKPSTLDRRWRANNQVTLTEKVRQGSRYERNQRTYSVYIPPAAASVIVSHLDGCLDDMDWLPSGYSQHDGVMDPEGNIHIID